MTTKPRRATSELSCGQVHEGIFDFRDCLERHKLSSASFGDLVQGVNLWWGEKYSDNHGDMRNLGYVIGLRNRAAGISWRLDYDDSKGAHVNQGEKIPGSKQWRKIYHPVKFSSTLRYPDFFWVKYFWNRWTHNHTDKMPAHIRDELARRHIDILERGPYL